MNDKHCFSFWCYGSFDSSGTQTKRFIYFSKNRKRACQKNRFNWRNESIRRHNHLVSMSNSGSSHNTGDCCGTTGNSVGKFGSGIFTNFRFKLSGFPHSFANVLMSISK